MSDHRPVPSSPDLVHLITLLARFPDLRSNILDSISIYLTHAAKQRNVTVDEVMADQERCVLGSMYSLLAGFHEAYVLEGLTYRQANAKAGHWFSERLAEFLEP